MRGYLDHNLHWIRGVWRFRAHYVLILFLNLHWNVSGAGGSSFGVLDAALTLDAPLLSPLSRFHVQNWSRPLAATRDTGRSNISREAAKSLAIKTNINTDKDTSS